MTTMTQGRTDIHRPSSPDFDPEAYDCLGVWDNNPEWPNPEATRRRLDIVNGLIAEGYRCGSHGMGQCGHCGAYIRYAALMAREDVKEWIWVGETCLDGRFEMIKTEFDQARKQGKLDRERMLVKAAWEALCDANPSFAYATYADDIALTLRAQAHDLGLDTAKLYGDAHLSASGVNWGLDTMHDIARKARRYGSASPKQVALVHRILDEVEGKWAAYVEGALAKKENPPTPVPTGRVVVEGTILSLKYVDGYFEGQSVCKMLVQADAGWRVYGTQPAAFGLSSHYDEELDYYVSDPGAEVGDRVRFTATIKRSEGDADFAFYSRPAKPEILQRRSVGYKDGFDG